MKKLFTIIALAILFVFSQNSFAQLMGTKTIPGTYATILAAITDLNAQGVGAGGVTFNVAAGYTETMGASAGGYTINIAANQPTLSNPVIFQKSGAGANPILQSNASGTGTITSSLLGANGDALIKLVGTDFLTWDGIDLTEQYTFNNQIQRIEYGILLVRKTTTDGCKNIIIKNSVITMYQANIYSSGISTANFNNTGTTSNPTAISGRHENIFIDGCTIQNSFNGMYFLGFADAASPYNLYDNNIQVGGAAGNTLMNIGLGLNLVASTNTIYGIYMQYLDSVKIINNNIRVNTLTNNATHYGIFTSTGTNSNIDILDNNISDTSTTGTTNTQSGITNGMGATGTNNTININNNTISNCRHFGATTGAATYISNSAGAYTINISGNTVSNNSMGNGTTSATGQMTGILQSSGNTNGGAVLSITNNNINNISRSQSGTGTGITIGISIAGGSITTNAAGNTIDNLSTPLSTSALYGISLPAITGGAVNIYSNTISNLSRVTGVSGNGVTYGILGDAAQTYNVYSNTIFNITNLAGALGRTAGYYNVGTGTFAENFYNNTIYGITNPGTGTTWGCRIASGSMMSKQIYGNQIYNISANGVIYGIDADNTSSGNIYQNRVSNITCNSSSSNPAVTGIIANIAFADANIYNNFIYELKAPVSTISTASVIGLNLNSISTANAFYNTIYLDASSSGGTFGTTGIYASTLPIVDLRNNIVINKSTPGSTNGFVVAYQRSSTTLISYASTSNNNNFYAGSPAANKLIYYDGTNSDQTITAFKTRVGPARDTASFSENTTFTNTSISPYDLHIGSCVTTRCESGGIIVSSPFSITTDYDNNNRYNNAGYPACSTWTTTAPDVGADEFGGTGPDITPPSISYTPLGVGGILSRLFSNVTITDTSGVNTTSGTRPRCYFKKTTNSNSFNDNTNATDGWKYAESNGTTSPFDFTINYSLLFGGGVVVGDTIQYFVVAQDLAPTPNVSINSGTFTVYPSSVNLTAAQFPITGTINRYAIISTFSGGYDVGAGQPFPTLTDVGGLFRAINNGVVSGNIIAYIHTSIVEPGTYSLNQWTETGIGGYTLTIVPFDPSVKTLFSVNAGGMINLNGCDRVTIDGNGGFDNNAGKINLAGQDLPGTKYLTFRNINGSGPAIQLINDARRNTITNCTIESNNSSITSGTIVIGTTTGSNGNDSNTISYCDIRDRSDANGLPANGIYSNGTTTTLATYNNYNVVDHCNIYNNFLDASFFQAGIFINAGTSDMKITSNSFYQTAPRYVSQFATLISIFNNSSTDNNINATGNFIGGTAPICGGSSMAYFGTGAYNLYGINLNAGQIYESNIQGNIIRNISLTTSGAPTLFFRGIYAQSGFINIGNVTGNTIGATTGNSSIYLNTAGNPAINAIEHTGTGNISNNTVGGITLFMGTATAFYFNCISWSNTTAGETYTCNNNLLGSLSTSNSIQQINNISGGYIRGIVLNNGAGTTNNCTNNTIANLTDFSINDRVTTSVYGILNVGAGNYNFYNNTVRNLANNTNVSTGAFLLGGIFSTSNGVNTFTQNTIYSFYANGDAGSQFVGGIIAGGTSGGTVTRNKIYDFRSSGTGSPGPMLIGINCQNSGAYNINNNMIALTNGDATISGDASATNDVYIAGINHANTGACNYYYNTIYVGGTQPGSGSYNSWAVRRMGSGLISFRNNLFVNARTGGTGNHYVLANESVSPSGGWFADASNYNALLGSNANTIGEWGQGIPQTIAQFRSSSLGDNQTWSTTTGVISPGNLFTNITGGDLSINSGNAAAWFVSGKGIALSGQNIDFNFDPRVTTISGGCTDIGADEFTATPPGNPVATESAAPSAGTNTIYTLWGRTVAVIDWGTGGTSYPSSVSVNYYSGVNPQNTLGGNYSNSYTNVTPIGTLNGTTYNYTQYFGDNETYTITSPYSNTLLAKYNTTWEVFPAGSGVYQSELNWANFWVKTRGLYNFSDFTLTDATSALPVDISEFIASVNNRNVNLRWVTTHEINNAGFMIQRRIKPDEKENTTWADVKFINGHGTTSEQQTYNYTDTKLNTGKYEYRLKQQDYNGHNELYNLADAVTIGNPAAFDMSQNYPNPSNPKSKIDFAIPFTGKVTLKVYDVLGKEITTMIDKNLEAGFYTSEFDGTNLASGIYFYRITSEGNGQSFNKTLKMVLVK